MADTTYFGNKNLAAIATIFATAMVLTGGISATSGNFTNLGVSGTVTSTNALFVNTTSTNLFTTSFNGTNGTSTSFFATSLGVTNLVATNVSSSVATTTRTYVGSSASCTALATGGGLLGMVAPTTGFFINASNQIQFCLNGNTSAVLDSIEGLLQTTIAPVSPNTGSVGSATRPYASSNIQFASSTTLLINGIMRMGANNVVDLGSTTGSVRNIYASGTAALFNVTSTAVTTSFMYITSAPAAGTGLNPFCSGTGGQVTVGTAGVCPVSALDMKNNVRPIKYGLDEIMQTSFYDFELKNDPTRTRSGVVADWSDKIMPEYTIHNEDGKIIGVDTNSIVSVIGHALQQLIAKVTGLEHRLNQQQREIDDLKAQIQLLKK